MPKRTPKMPELEENWNEDVIDQIIEEAEGGELDEVDSSDLFDEPSLGTMRDLWPSKLV